MKTERILGLILSVEELKWVKCGRDHVCVWGEWIVFSGSFWDILINNLEVNMFLCLYSQTTVQAACCSFSTSAGQSILSSPKLQLYLYVGALIISASVELISMHVASPANSKHERKQKWNDRFLSSFLSYSTNERQQRKQRSGLDNLAVTERINSVWLDDTGQSPWGMWRTGGRERAISLHVTAQRVALMVNPWNCSDPLWVNYWYLEA